MDKVRQFQAVWLTITVLVWMGSAQAEPPTAPSAAAPSQVTREQPRVIPASGSLDPAVNRFVRDDEPQPDTPVIQVTSDARVVGNAPPKLPEAEPAALAKPEVVHSHAEVFAPRWVTIQGDVDRPGSHELDKATLPLAELLKRSGGQTDASSKTIHIIRAGAALDLTVAPDQPLLPGDLVIVRKEGAPAPKDAVRLGVIGLFDEPIAVSVSDQMATLTGIQKLARQPQLKPEDVKVLIDGQPQADWTTEKAVPDCAVLVFAADKINREALPSELPTIRYGSQADEPIQLVQKGTTSDAGDAPAYHAANTPTTPSTPSVPAISTIGPPADDFSSDISMLPKVDSVPPPPIDDLPTRTADLSGSVPIGPAEMESHIMSIPGNEFAAHPTKANTLSAAPAPPEATEKSVGLPAKNTSKLRVDEDSNQWDLWPVVLMGMLIGGSSFYLLRRWKERSAQHETPFWSNWFTTSRQNSASPRQSSDDSHTAPDDWDNASAEPATIPMTAAKATEAFQARQAARSIDTHSSRATFLTALVSNQLPLREEPVELPATLFVQGRSNAPARRRVDAGDEGIPAPHVVRMPVEQPESRLSETVNALLRSHAAENSHASDAESESTDTDFAEDCASIPLRVRRSGTPFEQALANRRRGPEPRDTPT